MTLHPTHQVGLAAARCALCGAMAGQTEWTLRCVGPIGERPSDTEAGRVVDWAGITRGVSGG